MIPYGTQHITEQDIEAVTAVLTSSHLTQGRAVPAFEEAVRAFCGTGHAVAVNSATSALYLACLALGLGSGDRLWTTPNTFVASANCGRYCGAEVGFVDIEADTGNICASALATRLEAAARDGQLPKVLVVVHFAGQPCDLRQIHALCLPYGVRIIEDASHAIGASYEGDPVGCGRYSDITVFSFHPVKIITTGEGGMAVTQDGELARHMRRLASHGITRDPAEMQGDSEGGWYYQQIELGYNFRLTDIQAALGCSQMTRLQDNIQRRAALADRYDQLLQGLPVQPLRRAVARQSAWHLYVVQVAGQQPATQRARLYQYLQAHGVGVNVHYIPVHTQPYYQSLGHRPGDYPAAEAYYAGALTLPLFPTLTESQQDRVVSLIRQWSLQS